MQGMRIKSHKNMSGKHDGKLGRNQRRGNQGIRPFWEVIESDRKHDAEVLSSVPGAQHAEQPAKATAPAPALPTGPRPSPRPQPSLLLIKGGGMSSKKAAPSGVDKTGLNKTRLSKKRNAKTQT